MTTTEISGIGATQASETSGDGHTRCGGSFSNPRKRRPPKSTLMLFAITVVFLLTFIPFLVIVFIRQLYGANFYPSLNPAEEVFVNILMRSYLVNNVANPIIYGMCNAQFKAEVTKMLKLPKRRPPSLSSRNESNDVNEVCQ